MPIRSFAHIRLMLLTATTVLAFGCDSSISTCHGPMIRNTLIRVLQQNVKGIKQGSVPVPGKVGTIGVDAVTRKRTCICDMVVDTDGGTRSVQVTYSISYPDPTSPMQALAIEAIK